MTVYGFTEDDFERVAGSVRRAEGLPPRREAQRPLARGGVGAPHNFVYVSSNTQQTINFDGGFTVQGYPGIWGNCVAGDFIQSGESVWFITANGETPTTGKWYEARCVGADENGQTVWAWASPPLTQTGLWAASSNPGTWSFTDDGTINLLSLVLPGDTSTPWFIHFGVIGRVSFVVGAVDHIGWCELDMSMGESIADPPTMLSTFSGYTGCVYSPFGLVPVAFQQTSYNSTNGQLWISGNEVYNNPNPYREFSQQRDMCGIVLGGKELSLSATFMWTVNPTGLTPSRSGIVDYAWIEAFQISPIPAGGSSGSGGSSGTVNAFGAKNMFGANGIGISADVPSSSNVTIGIGAIDGGTWT